MSFSSQVATLSGLVLREAQREREQNGWERFWPDLLAEVLGEKLADVLAAVRLLSEQGQIRARVELSCPNEDYSWAGEPAKMPTVCPHCHERLFMEEDELPLTFEFVEKKKMNQRFGPS